MFELQDPSNRNGFLGFAVVFEGGLMFVAFGVGWLVSVDPVQTLTWNWEACGWGLLGTLPMLALFAISRVVQIESVKEIHDLLVKGFGPYLNECRFIDLVLLATLAGVCEEIVFRGFLQPWIGGWNFWGGLLLANIVFGLMHMVTPMYAILAFAIGCYLSLLQWFTPAENLLAPITAHGVYDLIALIFVVREYRRLPIDHQNELREEANTI